MVASSSREWTLQEEMHVEFSAVREPVRVGDEYTLRSLIEDIRAIKEETRRVLRDEIRAGDEETRRHARILHEEVISRLALIQEGRERPCKRP
jgi:hypothetical protein